MALSRRLPEPSSERAAEKPLLGCHPRRGHPDSHGHLELLHPLPLHVLRLAEELEALLALQVDQVEAVGPLRGAGHTAAGGASGSLAQACTSKCGVHVGVSLCACVWMCVCICTRVPARAPAQPVCLSVPPCMQVYSVCVCLCVHQYVCMCCAFLHTQLLLCKHMSTVYSYACACMCAHVCTLLACGHMPARAHGYSSLICCLCAQCTRVCACVHMCACVCSCPGLHVWGGAHARPSNKISWHPSPSRPSAPSPGTAGTAGHPDAEAPSPGSPRSGTGPRGAHP